MDMINWAENEVRIACEKEHPGFKEGEWDYGCACYQSALKAYKSLAEDGHSGYSWSMTASILKRLMDHEPLTPIEDTDSTWSGLIDKRGDRITYQCARKPSLFKDVYDDGRIKYHDIRRFVCVDIHSGASYSSTLVTKIMHEKFPITFPYMPGNTIKVYCEDFLTDPKNGDFDTVGIIYCQTDDGKEDIKRYFKESSTNNGFEEINFDEYMERKVAADKLRRENNGNKFNNKL